MPSLYCIVLLHFLQYLSVLTDLGMGQQLLAGFCTEQVYLQRPVHEGLTCQEIVQYMLREEAKNTAKIDAYSGLLTKLYCTRACM